MKRPVFSPVHAVLLALATIAAQLTAPTKPAHAEQEVVESFDTELTRRVRWRLLDAEGLSPQARNIAIITNNGTTALVGTVRDRRDGLRLEAIARRVTGNKIRLELAYLN